ncbi:MAG: efflux RND transporter periplasmic adaptor subunit, partial [Phycisphaeraceae bacterium]
MSDAVGQLVEFHGGLQGFLDSLLDLQCRCVAAEAGVIVRMTGTDTVEAMSAWPESLKHEDPPHWLMQNKMHLAEVARTGTAKTRPVRSERDLYGQRPEMHVLLVPLRMGEQGNGSSAILVREAEVATLTERQSKLILTTGLMRLFDTRQALAERMAALDRLQRSSRVLAAINEQDKAKSAAMALCNELATVLEADRVSVGLVRGRYVKAVAISHTEQVSRKMELVQSLETAMEESLDQDLEVVHPAANDSPYVSRAAAKHAERYGPFAMVSLPLRKAGEAMGVLTVERSPNKPLRAGDVAVLRLIADLCTPRLLELDSRDRWVGARAANATKKLASKAVGREYTWAKLGIAGVLGAVVFLTVVHGADRIDAPFRIEAAEKRIVPVPFDGYLERVHVEPNDRVQAGGLRAELQVDELDRELNQLEPKRAEFLAQAATARTQGKIAESQIARARAEQVAARIDLIQYRIDRTRVTAPIDGVVLRGDLRQQEGRSVSRGDVLFEVAPLEYLRADLKVPEHRISDMKVGQEGELATAAAPGT